MRTVEYEAVRWDKVQSNVKRRRVVAVVAGLASWWLVNRIGRRFDMRGATKLFRFNEKGES